MLEAHYFPLGHFQCLHLFMSEGIPLFSLKNHDRFPALQSALLNILVSCRKGSRTQGEPGMSACCQAPTSSAHLKNIGWNTTYHQGHDVFFKTSTSGTASGTNVCCMATDNYCISLRAQYIFLA